MHVFSPPTRGFYAGFLACFWQAFQTHIIASDEKWKQHSQYFRLNALKILIDLLFRDETKALATLVYNDIF